MVYISTRRSRLDLNTEAEIIINDAIQEIEKMGADEGLTKAQMLLDQAKNLVSDYIDNEINSLSNN